jgi:hypothetical protein
MRVADRGQANVRAVCCSPLLGVALAQCVARTLTGSENRLLVSKAE